MQRLEHFEAHGPRLREGGPRRGVRSSKFGGPARGSIQLVYRFFFVCATYSSCFLFVFFLPRRVIALSGSNVSSFCV